MQINNRNNQKQLNISIPAAIIIAGFLVALGVVAANYFSKPELSKSAVIGGAVDKAVKDENIELDDRSDNSQAIQVNVSENDQIRGNFDAPITIIEWSDFQCPYCSSFHETMKKVMENYPNNVRWVYKHFPLDSIHPYAREAAEASECAAEQGNFWEYSDELFARQSSIQSGGKDFLRQAAADIGLNTTKFNQCLDSGKFASKVEADYQAGLEIGVRGTPGAFLNGRELGGAVPFEQLKSYIDALID